MIVPFRNGAVVYELQNSTKWRYHSEYQSKNKCHRVRIARVNFNVQRQHLPKLASQSAGIWNRIFNASPAHCSRCYLICLVTKDAPE
uniref:Uncharacterized protein n=1 Tax=Rhipicephalus appendiculatus TaxID=34631 RepID=A0A131YE22_RHIAP